MLKEAIDRIIGLAPASEFTIEGRSYSDKALMPVQEPKPPAIQVRTLTGLVDLIRVEVEDLDTTDCVIHVASVEQVELIAKTSDLWGRRQVYIAAVLEKLPGFPFGKYISAEEFAIALQANFVPDVGDVDHLVHISSTITADAVTIAEDDGVSQRVTVKSGVTLKDQIVIKRRVGLAPYRTFREIQQPGSEFVFRVRTDGSGPQCALFEADGGKWRLDAMQMIKAWLAIQDLGIVVAA